MLDDHETDVVPAPGVLLSGIPQADDQDRGIATVAGVTAVSFGGPPE